MARPRDTITHAYDTTSICTHLLPCLPSLLTALNLLARGRQQDFHTQLHSLPSRTSKR
jgi:hypothetical protein